MAAEPAGRDGLLAHLATRYPSPVLASLSYEQAEVAVRTRPGSSSAHRPHDRSPLPRPASASTARAWRSTSKRGLSRAALTPCRSAADPELSSVSSPPGSQASPDRPTRPAWIAMEHGDEDDGTHAGAWTRPEGSYEAVASAVERNFSFKGDKTNETALRALEHKLAKLKEEGLLNAYTRLTLEVETCGERTWNSKTQMMLIKLKNSLLRLRATSAESLPSQGASILQYATVSHQMGRLGAFEIWLVIHSNGSTSPAGKILLHTKLQTQCFPNLNAIIKILTKRLPCVMDFDENRRLIALLADDNAELRHDLQKSSALCSATEERLGKALASCNGLKFTETEMQHSRLRVRKQLSKIEKKMATLSSRLDASPEQQATQQTTNTDPSTSGSVTCLELCTAAHEDLRRLLQQENFLQRDGDQDEEERLRADLSRSIKACSAKDMALANLAREFDAEKELALAAARDAEAAIKSAADTERVLIQARMAAEADTERMVQQLQNFTLELHVLVDKASTTVDGFEKAMGDLGRRLQDERVAIRSESGALKERVRELEAEACMQLASAEELQHEIMELRQASRAAASQQQETIGQMVHEMNGILKEYAAVLTAIRGQGQPPPSPVFCKSLRVTGCKKGDGSDFDLVNGEYSSHMANGLPFYVKVDNANQALWYDSIDRSIGGWRVGPLDKVGSTTGHASVMSDAQSPELTTNDWNVFTAGQWQKQSAVRIVKLQ